MSSKKIVIIGPESTGKSTLAEALAKELHTVWAPEYAREYLQQQHNEYAINDLLQIGKGQAASEDRLLPHANKYLICDTDLQVIKVWSEHKYGLCDQWILEQIALRSYDLYLLTYIDVPWQEDAQREHPDPAMRRYFYNIYRDMVQNSGIPWADIRGNEQQRLRAALQAIKALDSHL